MEKVLKMVLLVLGVELMKSLEQMRQKQGLAGMTEEGQGLQPVEEVQLGASQQSHIARPS